MRKYVYTLKSNVLEKVIANYIDYVSNPLNEWRQFVSPQIDDKVIYNHGEGIKPMPLNKWNNRIEQREEVIDNLPKPRYETAKSDIIAVVDILYRSYLNPNDDNKYFTISSKYLKRASNNYAYILHTLSKMLIIDVRPNYNEKGEYDRTLYLIRDESLFHLQATTTLSKATSKGIQRIDQYSDKKHQEEIQNAIKATSAQFVDRYNKALSKLTIDKDEASSYVENEYKLETETPKKNKRLYTIQKISGKEYKKEIRAIDDNGRIYHIGTELQRDLKEFTNIEFSIDCKNSHPFLFSYVIMKYITYGNIEIDERYDDKLFHYVLYGLFIFLKENKGIYNHYMFSDFLCKTLKTKKLAKSKLAKTEKILLSLESVQPDVWQYIYDVAEGKIWDMFVAAFNEDRTEVKKNVFSSVLYSYVSKREKKLDEDRAKSVNMFKELYPSVYLYINEIKQSLHEQCKEKGMVKELKHPYIVKVGNYPITYTQKDEILLPMLLMKLESKIFTNILTKLFHKRIVCFGIHDAVAVIKSKLSEDEIKQIMMDNYKEYGLIPTLSVDHYN